MLSTALALALLTTAGCILVYHKLPYKIRAQIEKHSLITDLVALVGVYMLLGGTLTALVAGAICGIFISIMLHIANNKDDYLYLYDLKKFIKTKLAEAKALASKYGEEYRLKQIEEPA